MKNKKQPHKLMMNNQETAQVLGVSERTLWRLVREEGLPVVKVDRHNRYNVAAIQRWLDEHTTVVPPTDEIVDE